MDLTDLRHRLENGFSLCPGEHTISRTEEVVTFTCSDDVLAGVQFDLGLVWPRHGEVGPKIERFMKAAADEHEQAVARRIITALLDGERDEPLDENQRLVRKLYATDDAMVWAEEFCRIAEHPFKPQADPCDPGWVVGWFANFAETVKRIDRERIMEEGGLS